MKLSYNWLKDYLECDLTPVQVAEAMTSIGIEVDSVEEQEEIPGGLAGVVVAHGAEYKRRRAARHYLHMAIGVDALGQRGNSQAQEKDAYNKRSRSHIDRICPKLKKRMIFYTFFSRKCIFGANFSVTLPRPFWIK